MTESPFILPVLFLLQCIHPQSNKSSSSSNKHVRINSRETGEQGRTRESNVHTWTTHQHTGAPRPLFFLAFSHTTTTGFRKILLLPPLLLISHKSSTTIIEELCTPTGHLRAHYHGTTLYLSLGCTNYGLGDFPNRKIHYLVDADDWHNHKVHELSHTATRRLLNERTVR